MDISSPSLENLEIFDYVNRDMCWEQVQSRVRTGEFEKDFPKGTRARIRSQVGGEAMVYAIGIGKTDGTSPHLFYFDEYPPSSEDGCVEVTPISRLEYFLKV